MPSFILLIPRPRMFHILSCDTFAHKASEKAVLQLSKPGSKGAVPAAKMNGGTLSMVQPGTSDVRTSWQRCLELHSLVYAISKNLPSLCSSRKLIVF